VRALLYCMLVSSYLFLTGCITAVGGVWSGANLVYDRHSVGHKLSDLQIYSIATHALYKDDYFDSSKSHIDVAVFNGDILMAGHVETEAMREEAYRRVSPTPEYRRLFKDISIDPFRTDLVKDSWITTKIRSQIIADSEIDPRTFKIVTSDQIVYLMGDVMPDQADWVVNIARNTAGVVRVIKLFKYYHLSDKN
jgi:osmotically-inducible protein OsmY